MTPLARYKKDPDAVLPYSIEWSAWVPDGETLSTCVWAIDSPSTPTLEIDGSSLAGTVATAVLSGGTAGTVYVVRCRATTTPSTYVDDRSIVITVEDR
jgi:hypothetical protein